MTEEDEALVERIRPLLKRRRGYSEQKMFGGLCFMVRGHMLCGVARDDLMCRVGKELYEEALAQPHSREMDFTGRPLKGMVFVDEAGIHDEKELCDWVNRCMAFKLTMAPK